MHTYAGYGILLPSETDDSQFNKPFNNVDFRNPTDPPENHQTMPQIIG